MSNYRPGDPKAICDLCGFTHHLSELKYNYKGQRVCSKDWDPRHPLDYIRPVKDEDVIKDPRPEPDMTFITTTCTASTRSSVADFGTADCALSDIDNTYVVPSGTFDGSL